MLNAVANIRTFLNWNTKCIQNNRACFLNIHYFCNQNNQRLFWCEERSRNMEIIKTQEEDNRVSYKIIDPTPEFIEFLQNLQERKEEYRKQNFWHTLPPKDGSIPACFHKMDKFYLRSRYGHEVFLKKITESTYELNGSFKILQLTRDADGNIISVDPEGGPMISVGDLIRNNGIVSEITLEDNRIILTLRNC